MAIALVDLALVVGVVVTVLVALSAWSRARFGRRPEAFRCRLGRTGSVRWRRKARWRLRTTRAVWVHDVLLVQSGLLRLWVTPVAATLAPGVTVRPVPVTEVRGLGEQPVALAVTDEEGRSLDVAVEEGNRTRLVGPFLTAALPGLPWAPREKGS